MAKALSLDLISNSRQAVAGVKDVGAELETLADSLDDIAKEAQQSGDGIERGLGQGADGARAEVESATERMERSFAELASASKRESKKIEREVGTNVKRGAREGSEALDDMKSEGLGSAKELAAGFDGSADSIAGGFQEVAANAFIGFGPAGVAAGLAGAAGIGVVWNAIQDQITKAEELKEALVTAYAEAATEGRNYLSVTQIIAEAQAIQMDPTRYAAAADAAKTIGLDTQTYIQALAGDMDSLTIAQAAVEDMTKRVSAELDDGAAGSATTQSILQTAIGKTAGELDKVKSAHETQQAAARRAAKTAEALQAAAREQSIETTGGFLRVGESIDGVAGKLRAVPNKRVSLTVDPGPAERGIQTFLDRKYNISVVAKLKDKYGRELV